MDAASNSEAFPGCTQYAHDKLKTAAHPTNVDPSSFSQQGSPQKTYIPARNCTLSNQIPATSLPHLSTVKRLSEQTMHASHGSTLLPSDCSPDDEANDLTCIAVPQSSNNEIQLDMGLIEAGESGSPLCHYDDHPTRPAQCTWYLIFSAFTASLGMLIFGYHITELSASQMILTCASGDEIPLLNERNPILGLLWCIPMSSTVDFSMVSAMLSAGGLFGSLFSSNLTRYIGRKGILACGATIQIASAIVMATSNTYYSLILGRFLGGLGSGAAASVNAAYLADIAPDSWRGIFGSLSQVMLNVGILICAILNIFMANIHSWRLILIISMIPALLQLMCVPWISTSPKDIAMWFPISKDPRHSEIDLESDPVVHALRRLWGPDVDPDILITAISRLRPTINEQHENEACDIAASGQTLVGSRNRPVHTPTGLDKATTSASSLSRRRRATLPKPASKWEFITSKQYRCSLLILVFAHFSLQASGINVYFAYSHSILTILFDPQTAVIIFPLSIAYHVVLILLSGRIFDKWGRRPMFLTAFAIMGVSAFLLNTASKLQVHWLALVAFFGAVTGFASGMGSIPYILISEVVDGRGVASAAAISLTVNWITQGTYLLAFLPLLSMMNSWVFTIIGTITLGLGILAFLFVPETRGRVGAEIMAELNSKPVSAWPGIRSEEETVPEGKIEEAPANIVRSNSCVLTMDLHSSEGFSTTVFNQLGTDDPEITCYTVDHGSEMSGDGDLSVSALPTNPPRFGGPLLVHSDVAAPKRTQRPRKSVLLQYRAIKRSPSQPLHSASAFEPAVAHRRSASTLFTTNFHFRSQSL